MSQTKTNTPSFKQTADAGEQYNHNTDQITETLKQARQLTKWILGIVFSFLPIVYCWFSTWWHAGNTDIVTRLSTYLSEFISSGSFLWIAITVLVMSFLDLILFGFRKDLSLKSRFFYILFIIATIFLWFGGMSVFFSNISTPPSDPAKMTITSWVLFVLYTISSYIVSFKAMQEV